MQTLMSLGGKITPAKIASPEETRFFTHACYSRSQGKFTNKVYFAAAVFIVT